MRCSRFIRMQNAPANPRDMNLHCNQNPRSGRSSFGYIVGSILILLLLLSANCRNKPTVEECTQSFENFIRLQATDPHSAAVALEAARGPASQNLARLCTEKKSRARVLCEMKAKSIPDLSDCTGL